MTGTTIRAEPLSAAGFSAFGDVIDCSGAPDKIINDGMCGRFHDRAKLETSGGRLGISLFQAEPRALPYTFDLLERHPLGCQTFIPMSFEPFLIITAHDLGDRPGTIHAFLSAPGQAINFHMGTWHGVLTPLHAPGLFAVIDRIGDEDNLDEHRLSEPVTITT